MSTGAPRMFTGPVLTGPVFTGPVLTGPVLTGARAARLAAAA